MIKVNEPSFERYDTRFQCFSVSVDVSLCFCCLFVETAVKVYVRDILKYCYAHARYSKLQVLNVTRLYYVIMLPLYYALLRFKKFFFYSSLRLAHPLGNVLPIIDIRSCRCLLFAVFHLIGQNVDDDDDGKRHPNDETPLNKKQAQLIRRKERSMKQKSKTDNDKLKIKLLHNS